MSIFTGILNWIKNAEPVIAAGGAASIVTAATAVYAGEQAGHLDLGVVGGLVSAVVTFLLAVAARSQVSPTGPAPVVPAFPVDPATTDLPDVVN